MFYFQSLNWKIQYSHCKIQLKEKVRKDFRKGLLIMSALFNLISFTNSNAKVQRRKP